MDKQSKTLQQRIERTAARLAALKARQQAAAARERRRATNEIRRSRNRALVLWGVAMEREVLRDPSTTSVVRDLLSQHLVRDNECVAAIGYLDKLGERDNNP